LKQKTPEKNNRISGTLFIVATPIGNVKDITLRALEVLKSVDVIYAEDTRETGKLLKAHDIATKVVTYLGGYQRKIKIILDDLASGKNVALVSDRGTPCINDPGYEVVREAYKKGFRIVPIPGPNAALTALMASGFNADSFFYAGFPPKKGKFRHAFLERIAGEKGVVIFYESPHRLIKTLSELSEKGQTERECLLARELTKYHEELLKGTIAELIKKLEQRSSVKGEFVVILGPFSGNEVSTNDEALELACSLVKEGLAVKKVARIVSKFYGVSQKKIYEKLVEIDPTSNL